MINTLFLRVNKSCFILTGGGLIKISLLSEKIENQIINI